MALSYDDVYNINEHKEKFEGATKNGLKIIEQSIELANYEKLEMNRHTKLYELSNEDVAYNIRKNIEYGWFDFTINSVKDWIELRKGKIDKRKKYNEKLVYDSLVSNLQEVLDVAGLEILDIIQLGYETYAYTLKFTIETSNHTFLLTIPTIKKLTVDNMLETNYGKLSFGYIKSNGCYEYINSSYNLKDFKNDVQKIIELNKE